MIFLKDFVRLTPAPTFKREVLVFALTMIVLTIVAVLAANNDRAFLVYCLLALLGIYAIGRLVYRFIRPESNPQTPH